MINRSELNQEALGLDAEILRLCQWIAESYRVIGAVEVEVRELRKARRLLLIKPVVKEATS